MMYTIRNMKLGLRHPNLLMRGLNRAYFHHRYGKEYFPKGHRFLDEDWDILIILDACRFDLFRSENTINGQLQSRISRGSSTLEFLRGNFKGEELHDTVYLTANPQLYRHGDEIGIEFYKSVNVWLESGWDEKYRTVLPETMANKAIEAEQRYNDKRLIIHFIQPHYPFVNSDISIGRKQLADENPNEDQIWMTLMKENNPGLEASVIKAYKNNFKLVLPYVEKLIKKSVGKVVVTSDHGNLLGERAYPVPVKEWGHPDGIYVKELTKVPWFVVDGDERRDIISEEPVHERKNDHQQITEERLNALGYVSK